MKKLRLDPETLSVQTFESEAALVQTRRTVFGNAPTNEFVLCPAQSGIVNLCHTWDMYDANCVFSAGGDEYNCTPVCQTGMGVCHSVPEGCVTGVRCETSPENCG